MTWIIDRLRRLTALRVRDYFKRMVVRWIVEDYRSNGEIRQILQQEPLTPLRVASRRSAWSFDDTECSYLSSAAAFAISRQDPWRLIGAECLAGAPDSVEMTDDPRSLEDCKRAFTSLNVSS
jgi:hypothetical protein